MALARALSFYPEVICLDEPISALDDSTKEDMIDLLKTLKENTDLTILHVTHSKAEAVKLGDKVFKFSSGQVKELQLEEL